MRPFAGALTDRRLALWALAWTAVALAVFGLVSAVIPNPVFGRSVPPEPFAYVVWLVSAPLMGILAATYMVPAGGPARAVALGPGTAPAVVRVAPGATVAPPTGDGASAPRARDGSVLGTVAGFGAFLAIGCPLCNKVVLVALGASGAMTIWAPLQPIVGAASVALLVATVAWRLRRRAAGDACAVPLQAR
ncbi:MAG: hypothetical protein MUE82_04350 [Chloroflexi bacterium]|jgi:hypothetical protein|nr:hypothetical protein [Chloroflexota bacterium]